MTVKDCLSVKFPQCQISGSEPEATGNERIIVHSPQRLEIKALARAIAESFDCSGWEKCNAAAAQDISYSNTRCFIRKETNGPAFAVNITQEPELGYEISVIDMAA